MTKYNFFKTRAVSGVVVLTANRVISQVLMTLGNLVLARLLFPGDFGIYAMLVFVVGVGNGLVDWGLSASLVQKAEKLSVKLLRTVWLTQVVMGVSAWLIIWLGAPLVLEYYGEAMPMEAVSWLRWLSLSLIAQGVRGVSMALLEREMRYREMAAISVMELGVMQIVSVGLAVSGMGAVSLVWGGLIGKFISLILALIWGKWSKGVYWNWFELKKILNFGTNVYLSSWWGLLGSAFVPLWLGKYPGPGGWSGSEAVGFVGWASGVAALVLLSTELIKSVVFSWTARMQKEPEAVSRMMKRVWPLVTMMTFLSAVLVVVWAEVLVEIFYGSRWLPAVPALRWGVMQFSLLGLGGLAMQIYLAKGKAVYYRNIMLIYNLAWWILGVPMVARFGFTGVNMTGAVVGLVYLTVIYRLQHTLKIGLVKEMVRVMLAAGGLGLGVVLVKVMVLGKAEWIVVSGMILSAGIAAVWGYWTNIEGWKWLVRQLPRLGSKDESTPGKNWEWKLKGRV